MYYSVYLIVPSGTVHSITYFKLDIVQKIYKGFCLLRTAYSDQPMLLIILNVPQAA